jgi:hypothetical protein
MFYAKAPGSVGVTAVSLRCIARFAGRWHHELANFCPKDFAELTVHARAKLRRTQRRKTLIAAFWKQAELPIQCNSVRQTSKGRSTQPSPQSPD